MINKVEVFECSKCARMSRREEEITKCLEKHEVDRVKTELKEADLAKINVVKFHLVNNLKSRRAEDISRILSEAAAMLGFELIFSKCENSRSYGGNMNNINIAGTFRCESKNAAKIKSSFNVRLDANLESLSKDTSPSIAEFVRFISGVEQGHGCYGYAFNGFIDLKPDEIPAIKELITDHADLEKKRLLFGRRQAELKKSYVATRLPVLKITDISYLNTEDLYKDITIQIAELTTNQQRLRDLLASREKELREVDNEDGAITPEPEYSYDSKRLEELNLLLGIKS